jgi:hypothetical protein
MAQYVHTTILNKINRRFVIGKAHIGGHKSNKIDFIVDVSLPGEK